MRDWINNPYVGRQVDKALRDLNYFLRYGYEFTEEQKKELRKVLEKMEEQDGNQDRVD